MSDPTLTRQTYNLGEVAVLLGVSQRYVYTLAREGRLPGVLKFSGRWLMPRTKLSAILNGEVQVSATVEAPGGLVEA